LWRVAASKALVPPWQLPGIAGGSRAARR